MTKMCTRNMCLSQWIWQIYFLQLFVWNALEGFSDFGKGKVLDTVKTFNTCMLLAQATILGFVDHRCLNEWGLGPCSQRPWLEYPLHGRHTAGFTYITLFTFSAFFPDCCGESLESPCFLYSSLEEAERCQLHSLPLSFSCLQDKSCLMCLVGFSVNPKVN